MGVEGISWDMDSKVFYNKVKMVTRAGVRVIAELHYDFNMDIEKLKALTWAKAEECLARCMEIKRLAASPGTQAYIANTVQTPSPRTPYPATGALEALPAATQVPSTPVPNGNANAQAMIDHLNAVVQAQLQASNHSSSRSAGSNGPPGSSSNKRGRLSWTGDKRVHHVYEIRHRASGKCYIGQSTDVNKRFKAHIKNPNKKIKGVLQEGETVASSCACTILYSTVYASQANSMEKALILERGSLNILKGNHPINDPRLYYMLKKRKRL